MSNKRIPRKTKSGKIRPKDKHSDLYTDENPKGTIKGLGFKDLTTARKSISKIKNSVAGKIEPARVYRKYINSIKKS